MRTKHIVAIFPGLGDDVLPIHLATRTWKFLYGLDARVTAVPWLTTEQTFDEKFQTALDRIDAYTQEAETVSIIGVSGSGSLAYNLFCERQKTVHRCILNCARLRVGDNEQDLPTLDLAATGKPDFKESVLRAEANAAKARADHSRIMTLSPRFGDEMVPVTTMTLPGAYNAEIPTFEHLVSISYSFLFPQKMVKFLRANES